MKYLYTESEWCQDGFLFKSDYFDIGSEIYQMKRNLGGEMWCVKHGYCIEKGDCGKVCDEYKPRNMKNGRCYYLDNTFTQTGKKFLVTETGLEENK